MTATAKRRIGAESSETRALIIEATEAVIREEGYAAASTRRVALRAGLKPSLVHYYFPTTDDLLLAVFEQGAAQSDKMIEIAVASDGAGKAVEVITANARTGQIGDGKIFVTPIDHALRIRTGETDSDAL